MIKFDINEKMEVPAIVLARRDHSVLGALSGVMDINFNINFNKADEISFTLHKEYQDENGQQITEPLWDEVTDFKYVYIPDLQEYFEIEVAVIDAESMTKNVSGVGAAEAELGQSLIYSLEVNTEIDIKRTDYEPTVFYNASKPECSLLNRVLDKLPNWSVGYVDYSIKTLQRMFSVSDNNVYDFLTQDVAEEIGCLFKFDSINRTISAYDLKTVCLNPSCAHRGEFEDVCPECGGTDLRVYGEETGIYLDSENFATELKFTTDVESVKNCFRLEAGDDNMTYAIQNFNPNGSPYIYYFSPEQKHDMPPELVERLEQYDDLVDSRKDEYDELMGGIYALLDEITDWTSKKMPDVTLPESNAQAEAEKLTAENLGMVGMKLTSNTSKASVNLAVKKWATANIYSGWFKLDIVEDSSNTYEYLGNYTQTSELYGRWRGKFKVTNWSTRNFQEPDKEETYTTPVVELLVHDNYGRQLEQQLGAYLAEKANKEENPGSIFNVLDIEDLTQFEEAIQFYCLRRLQSFYDAYSGCIDIMIEADQANESRELYNELYLPYYNKLQALQRRIDEVSGIIENFEKELEFNQERQRQIQRDLNFQKFLEGTGYGQPSGTSDLYHTFLTFKREDVYSNANYTSKDLDNEKIHENAKKFLSKASEELYKSGTYQHTIEGSFIDFLAIPEFEAYRENLELGNWLRVRVDESVYKLRLIAVGVDYENPENVELTFSDVVKTKYGATDIQSIISQASTMAKSYGALESQVWDSAEKANLMSDFVNYGLAATTTKIVNNAKNQNITINETGLHAKTLDEFFNKYDPNQLKLLSSGLYVTSNNWRTCDVGVGKIITLDPITGQERTVMGINAKNLFGELILGNELGIYTSDNHIEMNVNNKGFKLNYKTDPEHPQTIKIFDIQKDGLSQMYVDTNGELIFANSQTIQMVDSIDVLNTDVANIRTAYVAKAQIGDLIAEHVDADYIHAAVAEIDDLYATRAEFEELKAADATITGTLTANVAEINQAIANKVDTNTLTAYQANITNLNAKYAQIEDLKAKIINADYANVGTLKAQALAVINGYIQNLSADSAEFKLMTAKKAEIEALEVDKGRFNSLQADVAEVENLFADYATIENLNATKANIEQLVATEVQALSGDIEVLNSTKATITSLEAAKADIQNLQANKANVSDLTAANASIGNLNAQVANINTIMAGSAGVGDLAALHVTSANVVFADAVIGDAAIGNVSANKITSGSIDTSRVTISSSDGAMSLTGSLQQFKDADGKVRIQIGKDNAGNFTFILKGADGTTTLIDSTGVKDASAIADGLIVDSKVAANAGIKGSKLDIDTVVAELNKEGTSKLNITKVWVDDENQSLGAKLTSMTSATSNLQGDLSTLQTNLGNLQTSTTTDLSSLQTNIGKIQNNLSTLRTDLTTTNGNVTTLSNNLTTTNGNVSALINDLTTTNGNVSALQGDLQTANDSIDSLNDDLGTANGKITSLQTDVSGAKTDISGLKTDVNGAKSNITSMQTSLGTVQSNLSTLRNDLTTTNGNISTLSDNLQTANDNIDSLNSGLGAANGKITNLQTDVSGAKTDISGLKTDVNGAKSNITSIQSNLGNVQSDLETAQSDITQAKGNITTLQSGLVTAQSDIEAAQGNISTLQNGLGTANDNISNLQGSMTDLTKEGGTLDTMQSDIDGVQSGLDGLTAEDGAITLLQGRAQAVENGIAALEESIEGLQGSLGDSQEELSVLQTKFTVEQGKIDTLIDETHIVVDGATYTLKDKYMNTAATVDGISSRVQALEVADGQIQANVTQVTQTADGLTLWAYGADNKSGINKRLQTAEGKITTAEGKIAANEENISGLTTDLEAAQSLIQQNKDKITLLVSDTSTSSNIQLQSGFITAMSNNINLTGKVHFNSFDSVLQDKVSFGNLLNNSKFDVHTIGWVNSGGNPDSLFRHKTIANKLCAYLDTTETSYTNSEWIEQEITTLLKNTQYILSGNYLMQNYTITDSSKGFKIEILKKEETGSWATLASYTPSTNNGTWATFTKTFTTPNVNSFSIKIKISAQGFAGKIAFNEFKLERGDAKTSWSPSLSDMNNKYLLDAWTTDAVINGTTTINGGYIKTGTIVADHLNVEDIFGDNAVIGAISAYDIDAERITSGKINVQRLDLYKLSVFETEAGVGNQAQETLNISNTGDITMKGTISSKNYLAGTQGWEINSDGNAEFNDVTVRGSLILEDSGLVEGVVKHFSTPSYEGMAPNLLQNTATLRGVIDGKSKVYWSVAEPCQSFYGMYNNTNILRVSIPEIKAAATMREDYDAGDSTYYYSAIDPKKLLLDLHYPAQELIQYDSTNYGISMYLTYDAKATSGIANNQNTSISLDINAYQQGNTVCKESYKYMLWDTDDINPRTWNEPSLTYPQNQIDAFIEEPTRKQKMPILSTEWKRYKERFLIKLNLNWRNAVYSEYWTAPADDHLAPFFAGYAQYLENKKGISASSVMGSFSVLFNNINANDCGLTAYMIEAGFYVDEILSKYYALTMRGLFINGSTEEMSNAYVDWSYLDWWNLHGIGEYITIHFGDIYVNNFSGNMSGQEIQIAGLKLQLDYGDNEDSWAPHDLDIELTTTKDVGDVRFYAGSSYENRETAPFIVYADGSVKCTKGEMSGIWSGAVDVGNIHIEDPDNNAGNDAYLSIRNGSNLSQDLTVLLTDKSASYFGQNVVLRDFLTIDSSNSTGRNTIELNKSGSIMAKNQITVNSEDDLSLTPNAIRIKGNSITGAAGDDDHIGYIRTDADFRIGSINTPRDILTYGNSYSRGDVYCSGSVNVGNSEFPSMKITPVENGVNIDIFNYNMEIPSVETEPWNGED